MRSIGLDNTRLIYFPSSQEWREIENNCYRNEEGDYVIIPEMIYVEPKLTHILISLNLPKLAFGHNVTLAHPEDIQLAFGKCESLLPFRILLSDLEVRSVHLAYTQDSPFPFDIWREHIKAPKYGTWKLVEEANGIYCNNSNLNERILCYGKDEHLRSKQKQVPQSVLAKCNHDHLIRIEHRLDRYVRKQLKVRKLWAQGLLLGSDLIDTEGFLAFVRQFEWRASQCVQNESKKSKASFSAIEKAVLSKPNEFIKFSRKFFSENECSEIRAQILKLESEERPRHLLFGIHEECKRVYDCYQHSNPISGKVEFDKLIYARSQ